MQRHLTSAVFVILIALLGASAWLGDFSEAMSWRFSAPLSSGADRHHKPQFKRGFIFEQGLTSSVHAPSIVELSGGGLMAAWYGGKREGSSDVSLYASNLDPDTNDWSAPRVLLDRLRVANDLGRHIRKLGNAVLLSDGQNNVWMFFVSTSVGGWSTSAINMSVSNDDGQTWGPVVRVASSPFLNISTLVKGHPFFYADGTIGLPVYHELLGKFAELLRLDTNGVVLDKQRMSKRRDAIQPDIALLTDNQMHAVLRNTGSSRVVLQQSSGDGGNSWSSISGTQLPNPDAAVSVTAVRDAMVMAYNDTDDDRDRMALAMSRDKGGNWRKFYQLEEGGVGEDGVKDEFSYPYLIRTNSGVYHLVYTWQRKRIAHVSFNDVWIGNHLR